MPYRRTRTRNYPASATPVTAMGCLWRLTCALFLLLALAGALLAVARVTEDTMGIRTPVSPPPNPASPTTPGI